MERFIQGKGQAVLNVCGCGKLHFTYGPITLHFDRNEFLIFAGEVGRLTAQLREIADGRGPALITGRHDTACH